MTNFLTDLSTIAQYVGDMVVQLFGSLAKIFVTTSTGESPSTQLTVFGILLLVSSITGLVIWIVDWIRGFMRVR